MFTVHPNNASCQCYILLPTFTPSPLKNLPFMWAVRNKCKLLGLDRAVINCQILLSDIDWSISWTQLFLGPRSCSQILHRRQWSIFMWFIICFEVIKTGQSKNILLVLHEGIVHRLAPRWLNIKRRLIAAPPGCQNDSLCPNRFSYLHSDPAQTIFLLLHRMRHNLIHIYSA